MCTFLRHFSRRLLKALLRCTPTFNVSVLLRTFWYTSGVSFVRNAPWHSGDSCGDLCIHTKETQIKNKSIRDAANFWEKWIKVNSLFYNRNKFHTRLESLLTTWTISTLSVLRGLVFKIFVNNLKCLAIHLFKCAASKPLH